MWYKVPIIKISRKGKANTKRFIATCGIVCVASLILYAVLEAFRNDTPNHNARSMDTLVECLMSGLIPIIIISLSMMCVAIARLALDWEVFGKGHTENPVFYTIQMMGIIGVLSGVYLAGFIVYSFVQPSVFSGSDNWIRMRTLFRSLDDGKRLTSKEEVCDFEDDPGNVRVPKVGDIIRITKLVGVTTPTPNGKPDASYSEWKHYQTDFILHPRTRLRVVEVRWSQRPSGHIVRPLDDDKVREESRGKYEDERLERLQREYDLLESRPYYQIYIRYERLPWAWING